MSASDAWPDGPVLVVALNNAADLRRVQEEGWYRIPLRHAPRQLAADYLAFYLTAAFEPTLRWAVRGFTPVHSYQLTTRRALLPDEPKHPRADERYYRIDLGAWEPLPRPVPSRQLRRITFIPTTLRRLLGAHEINDLWLKSAAHELLWAALQALDLAAEREYLVDEASGLCADFALPQAAPPVGVRIVDAPRQPGAVTEVGAGEAYAQARSGWRFIAVTRGQIMADAAAVARAIARYSQAPGREESTNGL